jgi:diguanylate cyclase (GGDEF)-like protein
MVTLRPAQAWLSVLFCADVAALADLSTGSTLWFGPVYLLVICVATWALGWGAGQITGIGCMGLTLALNGTSLYPHGYVDFAWNLGMRFIAISTVIAIIAGVRRAYVREWWLARTDSLTGALNRQAFFELATSAIDTRRWRLLIYADLDGLKKINDFQGHAVGDACLKAFGAAVRNMIRRDDIFARIGGDEFLIFMNVPDETAARAASLRLHKAMNNVTAESRHLNCSVGGLAVPPGDALVDALVRSADSLMYEAKARGASLELGVASDVQRPAFGNARSASRTPSRWASARRKDVVERRGATESFATGGLPH